MSPQFYHRVWHDRRHKYYSGNEDSKHLQEVRLGLCERWKEIPELNNLAKQCSSHQFKGSKE